MIPYQAGMKYHLDPLGIGMAVAAVLALAAPAVAGDVLENGRRPLMWRVVARGPLSAATVAAIGKKFGARIESAENAVVDAGGLRFKVNPIVCASEQDAAALHDALVKLKRDPLFVMRRGRAVVEFVGQNRLVVQKARDWIGWDEPATVTWRVSMTVAPLAHAPPMRWNRLFNALWAWRREPGDATEQRVRAEAAGFRFDDTAFFRTEANPWGKPNYVFDAKFADRAAWRFAPLPRQLDIPVLDVTATIPVRPFAPRGADTPPDRERLCKATPFWPVADPAVQAAVAAAVPAGKKLTPRGHVEFLLRWVQTHVRYDGKIMGSRYGVPQVIGQGFGHCWDKSDVFIALCRASGIPARQVGGWVDGLSGHIWCDVWIAGEGWLEVDATASWLGTSADYIPFWISEDGASPFVYWEKPDFRRS